jgi:cytochrome c551/c552
MKRTMIWPLFLLLALLLAVTGMAQAGGWAVLTLTDLPDAVTAGEPFTIHFAIRQHGQSLTSGLNPVVTAVHPATGETRRFPAQETAESGFYEATLTLPQAGEWSWEIDGFGVHPMPPLTVQTPTTSLARLPDGAALNFLLFSAAAFLGTAVAFIAWSRHHTRQRLGVAFGLLVLSVLGLIGWLQASQPVIAQSEIAPAATTLSAGEALFVAKGCIGCHQHSGVGVAYTSTNIGPDLSRCKCSPDYLQSWLRDPASLKPATMMPNLHLSDAEIEALIQFLTPLK